ncbi:MAG: hypothetical protein ACRC1T_17620 [Clostridium chrysemydis]|uniref:hypothetical protein n=1 Tax=Clostridium chrysemydis TaxID=2665504 RepID=UPI003F2EE396
MESIKIIFNNTDKSSVEIEINSTGFNYKNSNDIKEMNLENRVAKLESSECLKASITELKCNESKIEGFK